MTPPLPARFVHLNGRSVARALGRTLVLAPHPDDETIGCGGLLALLAQARMPMHMVLVCDGAGSHPHSLTHGPASLCALRLHEMTAALRELGCADEPLTALALPDGAVPTVGNDGYRAAFERLAAIVQDFRPDSVLLPWCDDPNPDHHASHALGLAVCRQRAPQARRLEYVVGLQPASACSRPMGLVATVWHVDIAPMVDRKRRALAHHGSQLGQVVFDDPAGITLTAELIATCDRPFETYYGLMQGVFT